jgi:hypothetical protein
MAHVFSISWGATTLTLSSSPYFVLEGYRPRSGHITDEFVADSMPVQVTGANAAALQTNLQNLESALRDAEMFQAERVGPQVFLNCQPDGYAASYRSEMVRGAPLIYSQDALGAEWVALKVKVTIPFTRRNYWEGEEALLLGGSVPTYNPTDAKITYTTISFVAGTPGRINDSGNHLAGYVTGDIVQVYGSASNDGIYTVSDGGHTSYFYVNETTVATAAGAGVTISRQSNFVEIQAAAVAGDLPSALVLKMDNQTAGNIKAIYISNNYLNDPGKFATVLEAEIGSGGTKTADATCSGGFYSAITMPTSMGGLWSFTIPGSFVDRFAGGYFNVLCRFQAAPPAGTRLQSQLVTSTSYVGRTVILSSDQMQWVDCIRIPPVGGLTANNK